MICDYDAINFDGYSGFRVSHITSGCPYYVDVNGDSTISAEETFQAPSISLDGKTTWALATTETRQKDLLWRIVRINENGTIKLMMQDGVDNNKLTAFGQTSYGDEPDSYQYMYYSGNFGVNTIVGTWYSDNLAENYDDVIETYKFCEAAKVGSGTVGNVTFTETSSYTPNFKCEKDGNNKQYVSAKVGLITVDELLFAGYLYNSSTTNIYLNNGHTYWTMSPAGFIGAEDLDVWLVSNSTLSYPWRLGWEEATARPVINLKANVEVTGNGTIDNPYIIKTN